MAVHLKNSTGGHYEVYRGTPVEKHCSTSSRYRSFHCFSSSFPFFLSRNLSTSLSSNKDVDNVRHFILQNEQSWTTLFLAILLRYLGVSCLAHFPDSFFIFYPEGGVYGQDYNPSTYLNARIKC